MNLRKEAEKRIRRKDLLIKVLKDLKRNWVLYKQIAIEFGVDPSRITRIVKNEDIYLSSKLVEKYLAILKI